MQKPARRPRTGRLKFLCVTLQGAEIYNPDTGIEQNRLTMQTNLHVDFRLFQPFSDVELLPVASGDVRKTAFLSLL